MEICKTCGHLANQPHTTWAFGIIIERCKDRCHDPYVLGKAPVVKQKATLFHPTREEFLTTAKNIAGIGVPEKALVRAWDTITNVDDG